MHASTEQTDNVEQAYRRCLAIAQQHYENFPTASRLLRPTLRPAVAAIYAFARHADDLADEGEAPAEIRLKQLDAWETLLERCARDKQVNHPVFLALGDSIRQYQLPVEALSNLLTAFRMDVSLHAYASFDELLFYCKHSANPVGRLMLALHGVSKPEALFFSDKICTALQLINFWQDLSVDLPRGRCYIPEAWLKDAGLDAQALLDNSLDQPERQAALQAVMRRAVQTSREMLACGAALLPLLPFRLRLQIAATLSGGHLMLDKISRLEQPLAQRASLNRPDWRKLALPVLMAALFPARAVARQSA
jgi:squalene synthase HpnC